MGRILKMAVAAVEICVDLHFGSKFDIAAASKSLRLWDSSSAKAQSPATFGRRLSVFGTVLLLLGPEKMLQQVVEMAVANEDEL